MLKLTDKWAPRLVSQPETGMSYQVATVILRDGRHFEQVLIVDGLITQVHGRATIPFDEADIADIVVTKDR
jgi:hypothetical protein